MSNKSKEDDDPPFERTAAYINAAPWREERDRGECEEAFIRAAQHGRTAFVKAFLAAGADVHAQQERALCLAAASGHSETMKLLIDAGARINVGNDGPLRMAATRGHTDTVNLLIQAGANVHAEEDASLRNAINHSRYDDHLETVKALLEAGADVHVHNDWPLKNAVSHACFLIAAALLEAGANVNVIGRAEMGKAWAEELGLSWDCGDTTGREDRIRDDRKLSDTVALVKLWQKRLEPNPGLK